MVLKVLWDSLGRDESSRDSGSLRRISLLWLHLAACFTITELQRGLHRGVAVSVVVSIVASQPESSWFESWSLHVLPMCAWVLSRYSGFLPPSKSMHVRLIGDSKLSLVQCQCAWLFVSFVSVWRCDGRATCPGCTPPLARWPLG